MAGWRAALLACGLLAAPAIEAAPALELVSTIPLPGVKGRIDHMSADVKGHRLFVAALGNDTVEIIDTQSGQRRTLAGLGEPQGVLYLPESGRVRIVVSDTGPGIPLDDRDKLFLPHFSTKVTGMGLGLPIVSEIATEHGGTVSVEDNEPRGSRFIIELPVARTPAAVEV